MEDLTDEKTGNLWKQIGNQGMEKSCYGCRERVAVNTAEKVFCSEQTALIGFQNDYSNTAPQKRQIY